MPNLLPTCLVILFLSMENNPTPTTPPEGVELCDRQTLEETQHLENSNQVHFRSFSTEIGQDGSSDEQKSLMSKLYRTGLEHVKSESHFLSGMEIYWLSLTCWCERSACARTVSVRG